MRIRIIFIITVGLLIGACSSVRDFGRPQSWNQDGQQYLESVHITVLPGLVNEHLLEGMCHEIEEALRREGLIADVEIYDRLELTTEEQRTKKLNARDYDVYGRMSLKIWTVADATYRLRFYDDAESTDENEFYRMELMVDAGELKRSEEFLKKSYLTLIEDFIAKLKDRELLPEQPREYLYDEQ